MFLLAFFAPSYAFFDMCQKQDSHYVWNGGNS